MIFFYGHLLEFHTQKIQYKLYLMVVFHVYMILMAGFFILIAVYNKKF